MFRSYNLPAEMYTADLQKITNTEEYKRVYYRLDDFKKYQGKIRITNIDVNQKSKVVTNPDKIQELKNLIIQEKLSIQNPLNHLTVGNSVLFSIYFPFDSEGLNTEERDYEWDISYEPIATWLKTNGYWNTIVTQAKDVESIIIAKEIQAPNINYQSIYYRFSQQIANQKLVTINNPKVITELLDHSQKEVSYQDTNYILKLKFKDKSIAYRALSSSEVTPEIYKILPE